MGRDQVGGQRLQHRSPNVPSLDTNGFAANAARMKSRRASSSFSLTGTRTPTAGER